MSDYVKLKESQERLGSAIAVSFKKNGEILVFISSDADNDEVMKSLILLSTQISQNRVIK